jgi:chromate transport protein ChrA
MGSTTPPINTPASPRSSLYELTALFLRLGATAMGGPAVHIAMMEEEVVTRRAWLTREEFLDFLGATNLIPGPNSTEMAIHIGRVRAGWLGLVVAGVSFILPAALMVVAPAWAYVRYGALPQIAALLYGVKPVVIVVIAQGAYRLARSAVKSAWLGVLGAMALAASALGVDPLVTLLGGWDLGRPCFFSAGTGHKPRDRRGVYSVSLGDRESFDAIQRRFSVLRDAKDRRNAIRGWLHTGRVSPLGPDYAAALADPAPVAGRGGGGANNARPLVYYRDFCRLRSRRHLGSGGRHDRHFPAGVCTGRPQWTPRAEIAAFAAGRRRAGRD